ncbi:restriction endonuclease subunit S [Streptomyces griseorubiginosus]|uniref:restriction endonuclease subunit S n=1 Tax=Streptomyces griseorubiginosus TaxID=67304 RepID=UPI00365F753C
MTVELPALPAHWGKSRVDRVASVNARIGWKALTAAEYQPQGFAFLSTPNIKGREIDFDNVNYITEFRYQESPELKLLEGDVLLAKDGNTLGIVNLVKHLPRPATVNGSIAVIRPSGIDGAFLRYVLASRVTQAAINMLKGGMGVPHLFQWDINRLPIPVPPLEEQRRIADFLDTETARIDKVSQLRDRQRKLLEARRWSSFQTELDRAQAPTFPLRRVIRSVIDGPFGSAFTSDDYVDEGAAVVRLGNIGFGEYRGGDQARIPMTLFERFRYHEVGPGDVLIAGLGDSRNHAGRACVAPDLGAAIVKGKCFRARIEKDAADADFIALLLSSPVGASAIEGRGSTRSMINLEIVKSALLPIPPLARQRQLVSEHRKSWLHTKATMSACDRQLATLAERRQALITAAVTGQFDVATASGRNVTDGVTA